MQEKHPLISSAEQLASGGMQLSLMQKLPHYIALNHIAVLLCHNFKFDILEVQGEGIYIEILWTQEKKKKQDGKGFQMSNFHQSQ